jgi:hypothetical protein
MFAWKLNNAMVYIICYPYTNSYTYSRDDAAMVPITIKMSKFKNFISSFELSKLSSNLEDYMLILQVKNPINTIREYSFCQNNGNF